MAKSGLRGPFPLTKTSVNENVTRLSPGAYALGRLKGGVFYIGYVGRSDSDVRDRLHDHVGAYSRFKYEYYASEKTAFEKECRLYHDFNPLANKIHPDRPAGSRWKCPMCNNW